MHDTMKIDPARLKRMREARGWTQEQLAEIAGLNARTVQRVEASGKAAPETGMALAAVLDCALAELREEDAPPAAASTASDRTRADSVRPSLLIHALWMMLAGLAFLMVCGYKVGQDMAERDNAMCPLRQPAADP